MNPQNRDEEIRRKEQELKDREMALRLRELEAELHRNDPPLQKTVKHQEQEGKLKRWYRKAVKIAAFAGIVVGVIVAVRIASVLATALIIGCIAFVIYKIFVEGDRKS